MSIRKGKAAFEKYEREADLEGKCRDYGLRYGYKLKKLTGELGDSDRLLTGRRIAPACIYVELKTTSASSKLTPMQKHNRKRLTDMGYTYVEIRTFEDYKDLIGELNKHGVPAMRTYG